MPSCKSAVSLGPSPDLSRPDSRRPGVVQGAVTILKRITQSLTHSAMTMRSGFSAKSASQALAEWTGERITMLQPSRHRPAPQSPVRGGKGMAACKQPSNSPKDFLLLRRRLTWGTALLQLEASLEVREEKRDNATAAGRDMSLLGRGIRPTGYTRTRACI